MTELVLEFLDTIRYTAFCRYYASVTGQIVGWPVTKTRPIKEILN